MKNILALSVFLLSTFLFLFISCTKEQTVEPCNGKGTLNVENKLDSTITVKIVETHTTMDIAKDYTLPFNLVGNQPYTLNIDGPQYHKDTTIMLLSCDNKLLIIIK
jgi:invasion protein IalB